MKENDLKRNKKRWKNKSSNIKMMKQTSQRCPVFFLYIVVVFRCTTFLSGPLAAVQIKTKNQKLFQKLVAKYLPLSQRSEIRCLEWIQVKAPPVASLTELLVILLWGCGGDRCVTGSSFTIIHPQESWKKEEKKLGRWKEQERGKRDAQMEKRPSVYCWEK